MSDIISQRIESVRKAMTDRDIDTLMVSIEENRYYLSGYTGEDTQFDETAGMLFITQNQLVLATDSRFDVQASQEAPLFDIECYRDGFSKALPDLLNRIETRRMGIESQRVSVAQFQKLQETVADAGLNVDLVPMEGLVEALRRIKSEDEIEATRQALQVAEHAFTHLRSDLAPGATEADTAWLLEDRMRQLGAQAPSFATICAIGPNSALPHAIAGPSRLTDHQPLLFDWGARMAHYCSDISRTIMLGPPDDHFKRIYTVVREAQNKAINAIRAGVSGKAVDAVARKIIADAGYSDYFGHGLGHGTGLAVHEAPRLSPLSEDTLEAGMIVTVEPGIYLPDWGGIRLENLVVVREDGAQVLNSLDLEPIN